MRCGAAISGAYCMNRSSVFVAVRVDFDDFSAPVPGFVFTVSGRRSARASSAT